MKTGIRRRRKGFTLLELLLVIGHPGRLGWSDWICVFANAVGSPLACGFQPDQDTRTSLCCL